MAKVISDEILKLKYVVNGDEAQKRVLDLELANKRLGITLKDLQQQQQVLSRQRKKDSDEYKQNQIAISNLTKAIADNKAKIDQEIKAMDVMSLTMEQLRKRANDLRFQLNNMNPNSPDFKKASDELGRLNGRMTELRTGSSASALSIQSLAGKFNHYSGVLTAALATMAGVAISIQSTIDLNNKLADAQTAVAKTTGMSNDEVKELTQSFSDFNTRTSRMDLLKIAEVGGRLGVPKEEIKSFTQEVDKMYVALGNSFTGGVEQVATQLGKIKTLFGDTKDLDMATAFNQIGSALNELGANGAASEANIADFTLRVGALPENLKPSVAETMALGAAFEESGIDAERAGTAYSTFVRTAAKESAAFAEVMGITKKEVDDLINKDPMQFFLKFAEGAKGLDTTQMASMLEKLKLNDQYVISILGSASENTARFRETIELSNQALTEATSLTNEFNKVNTNTAAIYEKLKKSIIGAFTSETVAKSINWLIDGLAKMVGIGNQTDSTWYALGQTFLFTVKILTVLAVGVISFNTAVALSNITMATAKERLLAYTVIQKLNNALNASGAMLQNLATAAAARAQLAYAVLTRNTELQSAAQARLNLITRANPFGLLLAVVMAAATAYVMFADKADEAANKQKVLNDVRADAARRVAEEKAELDSLLSVAKNENLSKQQRLDAIKRLNAISPEYLGNLTLENIKHQEAARAVQAYVKALDQKAMAEAIQAKKVDLMKKMVDEQTKDIGAYDDFTGAAGRKAGYWLNDTFRAGPKLKRDIDFAAFDALSPKRQAEEYSKYMPSVQRAIDEHRKNIKGIGEEIKQVNKLQAQFLTGNPNATVGGSGVGTSTYNTNFPDAKKGATTSSRNTGSSSNSAENKWQRTKEAMMKEGEKAKELAVQLEIDKQDAIAELQKDWYLREQLQIKADGQARLADLDKKMTTADEFNEIDAIIAKATGEEKKKFEAIKEQWLRNNADLENLKIKSQEITDFKLKALNEKKAAEKLKKDEEEFQRQVVLQKAQADRTIANLKTVEDQKAFLQDKISAERLAKIENWEQGKAEIEAYYQAESLEMQAKYLQTLVDQLEALPTDQLTPEQVQVLEAMRVKLAEIAKTKTEITNGQKDQVNFSSLSSFGNTDLLGLSPDQWKAMLTNTTDLETNINKVGAAIQIAQQMFAAYANFVKANEDAMLRKMEVNSDRKAKRLKRQLDEGQINQETYKKLTLENEMEVERKKAELEYKAAKRQRLIQVANIIASTSMAIMQAYAQLGPIAGTVAAVLVGTVGALQLATVMRTPLPEVPGAEDGFYPVIREQDGRRFNARRRPLQSGMYSEPTVLVGEAGANYPEMVIDGKTMKRLRPSTVQMLNEEISQVRGFEDGLYKSTDTRKGDNYTMLMVDALNRTSTVLEKIEKYGIEAYLSDTAKNGKAVDEMIQKYKDLLKNNKI